MTHEAVHAMYKLTLTFQTIVMPSIPKHLCHLNLFDLNFTSRTPRL